MLTDLRWEPTLNPTQITALLRRMLKGRRECAEVRELFTDYVDGDLEPAAHRRVEAHVGFCPGCRRVLANLRQTLVGLRRLRETPPPGADGEPSIAERVRSAWRGSA